eukprot:CAMPEP_0206566568 /NCGR_PEP_ID=MMETSP0325_2-20121206/24737_1 /ASSEMBLY_ACC=CAM_ASM_000347 /TAXON_ID=2866 /ORGANISM="Crypthecodinium cohnii, Strain Seligo" /LENGTH=133 /DNA_ID=CAMNT_0054069625 /DNA_START=282 /DNA_END=683 /DNA_ORIENTATION=+
MEEHVRKAPRAKHGVHLGINFRRGRYSEQEVLSIHARTETLVDLRSSIVIFIPVEVATDAILAAFRCRHRHFDVQVVLPPKYFQGDSLGHVDVNDGFGLLEAGLIQDFPFPIVPQNSQPAILSRQVMLKIDEF